MYSLHGMNIATCIIAITDTCEIETVGTGHDVDTTPSVVTRRVEYVTGIHFTAECATVSQVAVTSKIFIITGLFQ